MPAGFLYDNAATTEAVSSEQATETAMPITNLSDPQPRRRARLMGSAASLFVDFGAEKSTDCVGLISTTLTPSATIRARVGSAESLVEAEPLVALDFMGATPSVMTGWSAPRGVGGGAGEATYFNADGVLVEAAAGEWRIDHDPVTLARRGLLLEPQRTNWVTNSRALGAVPGTPGTAPTNWALFGTGGVVFNIAGVGVEGGIPYVDIRLSGTSTTGAFPLARFQGFTIPAAQNQVWTHSLFVRLVGGTLNGITNFNLFVSEWDVSQVFLSQGFSSLTVENGDLRAGRISHSRTLVSAETAFVVPQVTFSVSISVPIDATFRIAVPQLELGAFATSPILNPIGIVPAVTTREADNGSRIIAIPSEFSLFSEMQHLAVLGGGENATMSITGVDDGSVLNLFYFRTVDAEVPFFDARVVAGSEIANFANIPFSLGDVIRQAAGYAPNNMAVSENGAAIQIDTSGVLPNLTKMIIRQSHALTYLRRLNLYASRLTNDQLVALSGTGSSLTASGITADSGTINAEAQDAAQGNVILTFPTPALGRILRIDITDATNFTDIGLLIAGALWRTARSIAYGIEEGREILDRRDRNPFTGAEFPVPAIINPRFARFTLPVISDAEVRDNHRDLVRLLGAAKDGLVIPDLADGLAERNRRALWGALNLTGGGTGTTMRAYSISERSFSITERV
jgi:hypothetical protein